MKSLTDIPSEHKCHRNFYKMVWGDLTCKECGNKGLLFRKTYEYCPHCKKKYSVNSLPYFGQRWISRILHFTIAGYLFLILLQQKTANSNSPYSKYE